ncbi:PAS domain-containing protein [Streptomyces daghestanicus]|uniref:PAC domain-containing protein n=1 Tax=Streptomyces daghestanicus TaxID=66885 RepID=A0ABQ3PWS9_9ACTN|nr:PAS domain-containing protein [Streptomyces daghestanicus]GGU56792.1 hypothetical protein GCM10010259_54840 [Streptomyces daghestanicus]GHI29487.1 hypothetical protein Sdagh_12170 [Streptomyces daghestanicus]
MPSPLSADHPAAQPSGPGTVEALISQTRRLKGEVDAVRRDARHDGSDPTGRWQRALYDLALHQLDDVDRHLAQLRDGPPLRSAPAGSGRAGSSPGLVGSAEWDLLTDGAHWSPELYRILGRDPAAAPLTLDELPSVVLAEDRPGLTAMVTGCLVDARPIDGEFRVVRPDGTVRTVHMRGRPVLDAHGSTVSLWAVLRDVTALRRGRRAVSESRASLPDPASAAPARPAAPRARPAPPRLPGAAGLDLAAVLPPESAEGAGALWYDACATAGGEALLSMVRLTGPGPDGAPEAALLAGTLRGLALAGLAPGTLLDRLARQPGATGRPALDTAVCCLYRAADRTLRWACAGHPAPLLFRGGTGRLLGPRAEEPLEAGDLLVLHTSPAPPDRLLALAPRLAAAESAGEASRVVARESAGHGNEVCVLTARVEG